MASSIRHRITLSDGSTILVHRVYRQPGAIDSDVCGWRRCYGYRVRDGAGAIVVSRSDLGGPCGRWSDRDAPSAQTMLGSLLAFLEAAGEHYRYQVVYQHRPTTDSERMVAGETLYRPDFSVSADLWAYEHDDELTMARLEIEG